MPKLRESIMEEMVIEELQILAYHQGGNRKKIATYHQYYAVNKAVANLHTVSHLRNVSKLLDKDTEQWKYAWKPT